MTNQQHMKINTSQVQDMYTPMFFIWGTELNELYYNLFI